MKQRMFAQGAACLLLAFALCACGANPKSIRKNPGKYNNQKVNFKGTVRDVIFIPSHSGAKGGIVYKLKTGAGENDWIWVLRGEQSKIRITPLNDSPIVTEGIINVEYKARGADYSPIIVETDAKQDTKPPAPGSVQY